MIPYWIQHADFAFDEYEASSPAAISDVLLGHDWANELEHGAALQARGAEWCPPGLGINPAEGGILHFYFQDGPDVAGVMYDAPQKRSLFGLFAGRQPTDRHAESVPRSEWPTWVERFCAADHAWLVARTH